MNRRRLRRLITVLRHAEEGDVEFNMGTFYTQNECGTVACALGHAALDPKLKSEGLKIVKESNFANTVFTGWVKYRGEDDYDAGAKFFQLEPKQSNFLFNPCGYRKRKSVVQDYDWAMDGNMYSDYDERRRGLKPADVIVRIEHLLKEAPKTKRVAA